MFIISGPSGAGKGTIVQELLARRTDLTLSVSVTTRPARPMEVEGRHYFFISEREFLTRRERGDLLEWAQVHGNYYGTPRGWVEAQVNLGKDVLLEIDVQGAAQIKTRMPEAKLIFIEPPSMAILEDRLRSRRTELEDAVSRRIAAAHDELRRKNAFDGVIVNDTVDRATEEVLQLMEQLKGAQG